MFIRVAPANHRPIYQQIASQITYAIAAGSLPVGQSVPSVRELAGELLVNPNTVARAYRDLQGDGILEPRRGLGLFVSEAAPAVCRRARSRLVRDRLRDVLREAAESDLPPEEIQRIVDRELNSLKIATRTKG